MDDIMVFSRKTQQFKDLVNPFKALNKFGTKYFIPYMSVFYRSFDVHGSNLHVQNV